MKEQMDTKIELLCLAIIADTITQCLFDRIKNSLMEFPTRPNELD